MRRGPFRASCCLALTAVVCGSGGAAVAAPARLAFDRVTARSGQNLAAVWIAHADGTHQRRLGPGDQPLLAPSGGAVAARLPATSANAFAIYPTAGGRPRRYFASGDDVLPLAWSPDSRYLAVSVNGLKFGLYVIDTRTRSVRFIGPSVGPTASFAPTRPDRLVYSLGLAPYNADLYTSTPSGGHRHRLTRNGRSRSPLWGRGEIAFTRVRQIWLIRPDGTHLRRLTQAHGPFGFIGLTPLYWSANGRRLVAAYTVGTIGDAWIVSLPGGRGRSLTVHGHNVSADGASRDGRRVLISYLPDGTHSAIGTVDFSGAGFRLLVRHALTPSWNG